MSAIRRAMELLGAATQRLADALASPAGTRAIFARLGWSITVVPDEWRSVATRAQEAADAVAALDGDPGLDDLAAVLQAAARLRTAIDSLATAPPGVDRELLLADLRERLLPALLVDELARRAPRVASALRGLGVIEKTVMTAQGGRRTHVRYRLATERLAAALRDPRRAAEELYGWGTSAIDEDTLLPWLLDVTADLGLPAHLVPIDGAFPGAPGLPVGRSKLEIPIIDVVVGGVPVRLAVDVAVALPDGSGHAGLVIAPSIPGLTHGVLHLGPHVGLAIRAGDGTSVELAVVVRPGDVEVRHPGAGGHLPDGGIRLECTVALPDGRLGARHGTRLALDGLTASVALADRAGLEVAFEVRLDGARLVVAAGGQDAVVRRLIGDRELTIPITWRLGWSSRTGLDLALGAEVPMPLRLTVGPLTLERGTVSLDAVEGRVEGRVTAGATLALGPVALSIDRFGMRATVDADRPGALGIGALDVEPVWPTAAGFAVDAGPVTGGGVLLRDPASGQYAGAVTLTIAALQIAGAALVASRTPEGTPQFSLAALASARFPAVPIGLGFNLHGLGAVVALHRRVDDERVRRGVGSGDIRALLRPDDPMRDLPALLDRLQTFFPVSRGRHVIGPSFELGWGSPRMLAADLAVLLELPAPVRVVVIGSAELGLPTLSRRIVDLRLELLGVVDLARRTLALDAALHHSTIAGYELTGAMALRVGWGDDPHFLLAIGGFHPRFKAPPGFPALPRVALTIGDNPRLRLEAYLALTSNTAQLGAHVDLHYQVAGLRIAGHLHFDALLELRPLHLEAELKAGVSISYRGHNLASASLAFLLTGPTPWRAKGRATIGILWWDVSVGFDVTWGPDRAPELPPPPDVAALLRTALAAREAWAGELPAGERSWLVLRGGAPDSTLRLHPLAAVVVRQRAVPLDHQITQLGSAPLPAARRFRISRVRVGTTAVPATPVEDTFAPGQFTRLRQDERLVAPSFESMRSGVRFGTDAVELGDVARASMEHDTVVHDPLAPSGPPGRSGLSAELLAALVAQRPIAGPVTGGVRVRPRGYVLASTRDLSITGEGAALAGGRTTYAGLREALRAANRGRRPGLQIVPRIETTNGGGRVVVVREDDNLRNVDFVDTVTGRPMTRGEFVEAIEAGEYPDYDVRIMNGLPTPVSRANTSTADNLG